MAWKLLHREPGWNMRFFSDEERFPGKICPADNSGKTPNSTDDGILFVDFDTPMELFISTTSGELRAHYAVSRPTGESLWGGCGLSGAYFLLSKGIRVELRESLKQAMPILLQGCKINFSVDTSD